MTTTIDVVIPTVGRPELRRALLSVNQQRIQPISLTVVCDNDDRWSEVRAVVSEFPAARLIRNDRRQRASGARNAGASIGEAPALAFLDDDDWWESTFLECMSSAVAASQGRYAYAYCGVYQRAVDPHGMPIRNAPPIPCDLQSAFREGSFCPPTTSCLLLNRASFNLIGGFDEELTNFEDWYLLYNLSQSGAVVRVPDILVNYWQHDGARLTTNRAHRINAFDMLEQKVGEPMPNFRRSMLYSLVYKEQKRVLKHAGRVRSIANLFHLWRLYHRQLSSWMWLRESARIAVSRAH